MTENSMTETNKANRAAEHLKAIIERMGYPFEVEAHDEQDRILLKILGDKDQELTGTKGQTLDALQFIVGRIMVKEVNLKRPVVIDSGGFRERRQEALIQMAERLREKAVSTGKTIAVNPMSAHDRRILHLALKDAPDVSTRSEGEGVYRRVLVVPKHD